MKTLLFIYNPNAGKGIIKRSLSQVIEKLSQCEYSIRIFPTSRKGDAKDTTYSLGSEVEIVLCSGGDGTLNEVINGIMRLREEKKPIPKLAYLPSGTVNDFANSFGIPKSIRKALDIVMDGEDILTDIGGFEANDKRISYFSYVVAFGAIAEVSYETPQSVKNIIGKAAYFLEGLKKLPKVKPYHLKVTFDDGELEDDFVFGMIANSKSVGGFKGITGPEVYLDDGKFDVILVKNPKNPLEFQTIINSFITMNLSTNLISHFHSKQVKIEAENEVHWTMDGEDGGLYQEILLKNYQKAIEIRTPKRKIGKI